MMNEKAVDSGRWSVVRKSTGCLLTTDHCFSFIISENEMAQKDRATVRRAVHKRIRRKVQGTAARPRLTIYRSLNHIYAQIVDDEQGRTVAAASTTEKDLR